MPYSQIYLDRGFDVGLNPTFLRSQEFSFVRDIIKARGTEKEDTPLEKAQPGVKEKEREAPIPRKPPSRKKKPPKQQKPPRKKKKKKKQPRGGGGGHRYQ